MKGARFGLNTADRPEDLSPGEATEALNVHFASNTIRKRSGHRPRLAGDPSNTLSGGIPSASLYVVGEEWWTDQDQAVKDTQPTTSALPDRVGRKDFYNQRQGLIVIPENDLTGMRLDCQENDVNWAIEVPLWTDSLPLFRNLTSDTANSIIVVAKSLNTSNSVGTSSQWAVRIIPSGDRLHAVLTLYEGSSHTAGTDFGYSNAGERAWIQPGRKVWLAWKYTQSTATITSYYWIEGATSVVSSGSAGNVASTLRTNGVGGDTYPICIGRRLAMNNAVSGTVRFELGFNGVVSDLRYWECPSGSTLDLPTNWATVTADPPASTDWYVDTEIPDEQLTTDTNVENGNIAQDRDLVAYWQFKPELVGVTAAGTSVPAEAGRFIRPRYRSSGATTPLAWLTGADATWIAGSGALGSYGLALTPAGPSGQEYRLGDAFYSQVTAGRSYGYQIFRGGLRIPNGSFYMNPTSDAASGYAWPSAMSVRVAIRVDALPTDPNYEEVIWEMAVARRGATAIQYAVNPMLQLSIVRTGGAWKFRWRVTDGAAPPVATPIYSSTVPAAGSTYVVAATARWWSSTSRKIAIYVNGVQESSSTTAGSKPLVSQTTAADSLSPNEDDEDGRDSSFPMSVGYTNETIEGANSSAGNPPSQWNFRYGCFATTEVYGTTNRPNRPYWGLHTNETKMTPNSGIPYRGNKPFIGVIGSLQIWRNYELNESEARRFADRSPNEQEIQSFGQYLASSWDMEEGQGTTIYDRGYLKNHLPLNPLPTVKVQTGVFGRRTRHPLLALAQRRERQVRSGTPVREVYAIGTGTVHKMVADSNGDDYLSPIGRCHTPQEFDWSNKALDLPTWFSFSDQLFFCTGLGPVKRITNGKVLDAGLTPAFGDIGQDQTSLGWREFDRDGTFELLPFAAASSGETVFVETGRYGYCITFYDPESGIESPPSRLLWITVSSGGSFGYKGILLANLPKSPQPNVTKYRVYRTAKDGSEFKLLDEVDINWGWYDTHDDLDLGAPIDSQLNFPPPQNARIGISFGARAIYAGVKETPNTVYYSLLGQPGSVPPQYQLTFPEQITSLMPYNDRVLVGTNNRVYALFDTGGDIAINSADPPPVQYAVITEETGCVGHHACVMVPGVGWVFPGERGLYATNGSEFRHLSDKVEPYWNTLNFNAAPRFVGVLHQRDGQYIMYHSLSSDDSHRNTRALVFDYKKGTFSTFDGLNVLNAAIVEDDDTGVDRIVTTDYFGNLWEYDPPDATVTADGITAAPYTGTVISAKKDAHGTGKYVRIRLSNTGQLPVAGSGLRGVGLYIANGASPWNTSVCRVVWNDTEYVHIESANATTSDPTGFSWKLGSYIGRWTSGKMDLGAPTLLKRAAKVQLEYGIAGGSTLGASFKWDEQAAQTYSATLSQARRFDTIGSILGRGRNCQISVYDSTATGGETNNPWDIREIEWDFFPKGRATFIGA